MPSVASTCVVFAGRGYAETLEPGAPSVRKIGLTVRNFGALGDGKTDDSAAIQKAVKWLKSNQRESGRWFTRSLQVDRTNTNAHLITNVGSVFCVLALHACGEALKD